MLAQTRCCPALYDAHARASKGGRVQRHRHVLASFATPLDPSHVGPVAGVPRCSLPGRWSSSTSPRLQVGDGQLRSAPSPDRVPVADARLALAGPLAPQPHAGVTARPGASASMSSPDVPGRRRLVGRGRVGAATVVQAGGDAAFYRWRIGDDNLTPHRPSDIVACAWPASSAPSVVLPLGPAPGIWLTSTRLRAVLVGRAEHRLHVRRQRLRDAAGPAAARAPRRSRPGCSTSTSSCS